MSDESADVRGSPEGAGGREAAREALAAENARLRARVAELEATVDDLGSRPTDVAALRESEARYQSLFESMDEAFAVVEVIADADGRWSDFLFLEVNPAFVRHTGMEYPVGRTATQLLGTPNPRWAEAYGRVVDTGEPIRFEEAEARVGRVFDLYAFRLGGPGSRRVAALFTDITERKRAAERQAFLLALSDAIRPLGDAEQIRQTAARLLGRHLGAGRVAYAEDCDDGRHFDVAPNYLDGLDDASGRHRYADYGPDLLSEMQAGRALVHPDVPNDGLLSDAEKRALAAHGVGSYLNVPLLKGGRLVAFLGVNYRAAHDFLPHEIDLVREVADRTWASVVRARAEAALRDSRAFHELVAGLGSDWWFAARVEPGGTVVTEFVSDGFTRMLGYTHAELMAAGGWARVVHPDDLAEAGRQMERLLAGETIEGEIRHVARDGRVSWSLYRTRPEADAAGRIARVNGVARDVTDRKRAEEAVRASEARLRALAANLPSAAAFVIEGDLRYTLAAGEALAAAGLVAADLEGKTVAEALPPDLAPEYLVNYRRALAGVPFRTEHEAHGRHYVTHGVPLRDPAGRVTAALAVSYDITDRKRAERELARAEEKLRRALAAARMGTWHWDVAADAHTRDANLNRLLGLDAVEARQPFAEFLTHVHPDDRPAVRAAFDRSVRHRRPLNVEFRVAWPDGTVRWLRDQGDVFGTAGGLQMSGACMDITDLKGAEAALRDARDRLEVRVAERTAELAAALDTLEAEMARRVDLARRLTTAQEDERRRLARDLHDTVGQTLTGLSLAAAAGQPGQVRALADALGRELHDVAVRLRPTALDDIGLVAAAGVLAEEWGRRIGVPVEFQAVGLGERVPAEVETALYRVVQEALTNAAKHARASRVSVTLGRLDGHATATVEDDGVGFDPDEARPAAGRPGGLGLAGMRERAALLGGSVEVESEPGRGTTVIARVPLPPPEKT